MEERIVILPSWFYHETNKKDDGTILTPDEVFLDNLKACAEVGLQNFSPSDMMIVMFREHTVEDGYRYSAASFPYGPETIINVQPHGFKKLPYIIVDAHKNFKRMLKNLAFW